MSLNMSFMYIATTNIHYFNLQLVIKLGFYLWSFRTYVIQLLNVL